MIHGFGNGIPQFYKNFDHLHSNRKLYAIDLPGFARSTRVEFTPDAERCEQEFVDYIEKWREGVGLDKFILLGHSLGGFLSCAYAMRHPSRVRHLILDDPWGFLERPPEATNRRLPVLFLTASIYVNKYNPFTPLRAAGPIGKLPLPPPPSHHNKLKLRCPKFLANYTLVLSSCKLTLYIHIQFCVLASCILYKCKATFTKAHLINPKYFFLHA